MQFNIYMLLDNNSFYPVDVTICKPCNHPTKEFQNKIKRPGQF